MHAITNKQLAMSTNTRPVYKSLMVLLSIVSKLSVIPLQEFHANSSAWAQSFVDFLTVDTEKPKAFVSKSDTSLAARLVAIFSLTSLPMHPDHLTFPYVPRLWVGLLIGKFPLGVFSDLLRSRRSI